MPGNGPIMDKLEELRLRYFNSLAQKAQDLALQWQRLSANVDERALLAELHQQVHRLAGSAPAYGFDEIGALARPVDMRLAEWLRSDDPARDTAAELTAQLAAPVASLIRALQQAQA